MNSEQAQELGPYGTDELSDAVGEEPARSAKIRDDMAHESFADRIGSVVAGGNEDGVISNNSPRRQSGSHGGDLEGAVPQCQSTTYPRGLETG